MSQPPTTQTPPQAQRQASAQAPTPAGGAFRSARRGPLIGANTRSAFEALQTNRSRSLLTMLGVIVGVGAVLIAVTLTQGASAAITARITSLGSNILYINNGSATRGGGLFGGRGGGEGASALGTGAASITPSLTQGDADAIAKVAHVAAVTPTLTSSVQVVAGRVSSSVSVEGVYPAEQAIGSWSVAQGRWLQSSDEQSAQPVAVLGSQVVSDLYPTAANPVGQTIFINGQAFHVIGVLQTKGSNQDDIVFIPFATERVRFNNAQYVNAIQAQVDNTNNLTATQASITQLLEQRHHIVANQPDDFRINSSNQIAAAVQSNIGTLTLLLVGIAAISLIVGGIGIMNIMLVSVTERTREIGVRMALGARRSDVRNQFLIEAITLSATGGLLGIVLGVAIGFALTSLVGLPFSVNVGWTTLAFCVSAAIGVLFGLYPAALAARLDPIVALRTE
ncbi:MAG TPA: ABC transporter permease [Ktedonobacterales bacterium]